MNIQPQLIAPAIGALVVWCFQLFDKIRDRKRRRLSTLVAIASEVQAICHLVRSQQYLDEFHRLANGIRSGNWDGSTYIIDIRGSYFKIFESNAAHISELEPHQVSKIVSFYVYCQSAIDSTRPDGPAVTTENAEDRASNIIGIEGVLMAILSLGDEIVGFPKKALPVL